MPLLGRIRGKRLFQQGLALLTSTGRRGVRRFGTRRLQVQMLLLVTVSVAAASASMAWVAGGADPSASAARAAAADWATVFGGGSRERLPFSPIFALMWAVGGAAAVACAWQAKYHRLSALALMSVAGLVTVITFA